MLLSKSHWIVTPLITILLVLTLSSYSACASEKNSARILEIYKSVQQKLDFYNKEFPDIQFVHLKNGEWEKSLQALELFIGYQATSLDYEHPKDLREDLLFATVAKIQMMLINKITSSYLFKAGQLPVASKKYICVLTLDPKTTVYNDKVSTQYFVDLPEEVIRSIPLKNHIDNEKHLDFIIDHEAFHCIDSYKFGGIPMSDKDYSTRYDTYKRESQADMFAIAMNTHRHKTVTQCSDNMKVLRGMTLLNGEPQHYSVDAMQLIISHNQKKIVNSNPNELVGLVKKLYKENSPSYGNYIEYRVAAIAAIYQLGQKVYEMKKPYHPEGAKLNRELVKKLVKETKYYYKKFTGKKYTLPIRSN